MSTLNISALLKVNKAYHNMLTRVYTVESKDSDTLEFFELESTRSGLIQHFEFSYELCWKFMERYLHFVGLQVPHARKELFRKCIEVGVISDFDLWVQFQDARNETSHTYDEESAAEVFEVAKKFKDEFDFFIAKLEANL